VSTDPAGCHIFQFDTQRTVTAVCSQHPGTFLCHIILLVDTNLVGLISLLSLVFQGILSDLVVG
jgi:hypothetical protein